MRCRIDYWADQSHAALTPSEFLFQWHKMHYGFANLTCSRGKPDHPYKSLSDGGSPLADLLHPLHQCVSTERQEGSRNRCNGMRSGWKWQGAGWNGVEYKQHQQDYIQYILSPFQGMTHHPRSTQTCTGKIVGKHLSRSFLVPEAYPEISRTHPCRVQCALWWHS